MDETAKATLEENHVKTNTVRMNWLILLLGIVLVSGGYAARRSYLGFERRIAANQQFTETAGRVSEACALLRIGTQLQGGGCPGAAQRLEEHLSASVASLQDELASADERTREMIEDFFKHMARMQSQNPPMAVSLPTDPSVTELAAQKTLAQTVVAASPGE